MNIKDMISTTKGGDLAVTYIRGSIIYAESRKWSNVVTFYDRDNKDSSVDVSRYLDIEHSYQSQYGVSLTDDGKFFFLQSWKSGLFCFELETGLLVWHCKRKKPCELVVRDKTVICRFMDQCVDAFNVETGELVAHYPLGYDTIFRPLDDDYYLVGPKRGKYLILSGYLREIAVIPYALLNPKMFDTFIVNEACFAAGGISISGFEYSGASHSIAIKSRTLNDFIENSRFTRYVAIDLSDKYG